MGEENFPLPPLNLDLVILEPSNVLKIISNHQISKNIHQNKLKLGDIHLNLQTQNNKPIYIVQQDTPEIGYRGMNIDAKNGEILFEKTDWLYGIEK